MGSICERKIGSGHLTIPFPSLPRDAVVSTPVPLVSLPPNDEATPQLLPSGIMNAVAFHSYCSIVSVNVCACVVCGFFIAKRISSLNECCLFLYKLILIVAGQGGDLRYCQKCSHFKPPRAHHCRVCRRCVLRMDHHCIWISNCVGHANYKVFFVFVVYAAIACIYSLVLLVGSLTVDPLKDELQSGDSFRTIYVISGLLLVPLSAALGVLLGWHVYLILQNKTTIEYHEGVRAMLLAEKGGHVYKHPYDVGTYENLTTVLGPRIFCWVCPTSGYIGSGLRFPTAYDSMASASVR
ncbi:ZINC FINGER DHHC DOMAIN CONTAINING PROTEIN [Salix purpurea]|uniref:S-acyltransferase n=1 Tax=Salix purpurea TaxID=77065 RepID=A0A9Q0T3G2_SALPP|nr:ZINC FINGER DHHC DOMAIN CONTAINING PROTEIN [Salix purpurea]